MYSQLATHKKVHCNKDNDDHSNDNDNNNINVLSSCNLHWQTICTTRQTFPRAFAKNINSFCITSFCKSIWRLEKQLPESRVNVKMATLNAIDSIGWQIFATKLQQQVIAGWPLVVVIVVVVAPMHCMQPAKSGSSLMFWKRRERLCSRK